ncbi:MAG: M20/M25/M40 family metallo-hydrolase [bacterium]
MTPFELTKRLIDIESITGHELAVAEFLANHLARSGFRVARQEVAPNRPNLWVTTGSRPRVVLCTHLDTVPPFYPASEDADFIYGRGACDVKGILAAMVFAAENLLREGVREFGLLFLCGEETNSIGAHTSNELSPTSEYIIVGEPTGNKLAAGHKGLLALMCTATGRACHAAFPQLGESAVDKLLDFLHRVRTAEFEADPVLGTPSLNIGLIRGGVAHNVVADHAEATVSIRTPTATSALLAQIEALAGDGIDLKIMTRSEPQKLFTVTGFEQAVMPYCTDIPHLRSWGKPLLIGPGDPRTAHTDGERIEKKQGLAAVEVYADLVRKLLSL